MIIVYIGGSRVTTHPRTMVNRSTPAHLIGSRAVCTDKRPTQNTNTASVSKKTTYLVVGVRLEDGRAVEEGKKYKARPHI